MSAEIADVNLILKQERETHTDDVEDSCFPTKIVVL